MKLCEKLGKKIIHRLYRSCRKNSRQVENCAEKWRLKITFPPLTIFRVSHCLEHLCSQHLHMYLRIHPQSFPINSMQ